MRFAVEYYGESDVLCVGDWNADGAYFDEESYQDFFRQINIYGLFPILRIPPLPDRATPMIALQPQAQCRRIGQGSVESIVSMRPKPSAL